MSKRESFNPKLSADSSYKSRVEHAVFHGQEVSRENIVENLRKDVRGVYILLAEVLASQECIEALADVFWKRYQDLMAQKEKAPELPLES